MSFLIRLKRVFIGVVETNTNSARILFMIVWFLVYPSSYVRSVQQRPVDVHGEDLWNSLKGCGNSTRRKQKNLQKDSLHEERTTPLLRRDSLPRHAPLTAIAAMTPITATARRRLRSFYFSRSSSGSSQQSRFSSTFPPPFFQFERRLVADLPFPSILSPPFLPVRQGHRCQRRSPLDRQDRHPHDWSPC
jgi:hypothetical protein